MPDMDQTERILRATQHLEAGRLSDAETICTEILRNSPGFAPGHHLLAHIAVKRGETAAAISWLEQGVSASPEDTAMWTDLGFLCAQLGRLDEAMRALERSVELGPGLIEAWVHLADVRLMIGEVHGAAEAYCRAVFIRPDDPAIYSRIAGSCEDPGVVDAVFEASARIFTTTRGSISSKVGMDNGGRDLSRRDFCKATDHGGINPAPQETGSQIQLECSTKPAKVWFNLAFAAQLRGAIDVAIMGYRAALELEPGHLLARNNLGTALRDAGQLDAAVECFRQAADVEIDGGVSHSNLLYVMHFQAGIDPLALRAEHEWWGVKYAESLLPARSVRSRCMPERRLRIGYVSPNFFEHPVGRFLLQLFAHHDRTRFEIFAYSSVRKPDQITSRLARSTEHWIDALDLPDAALAGRIVADGIDILVDLTMHMRDHRLLCFACKPAPIQVTYLAYCSTTGVRAIDYRLTDPYLDPPRESRRDAWYVEESVRLPKTYWCYEPGVATPEVNALPALSRGYVTFASLNNFSKVSAATLSAWGGILSAVRNSRLVLHCHRGSHRKQVLTTFASRGISADRIVLVDTVPLAEYFKLYQLVDIALDTFPYAGGTTTCDALWMGVPVVSLAGQTAVSRGGLSILSNAGMPDLAVTTVDQYIAQSVALASDLPRVGEMRATLRQAMRKSPLMDGAGFARDIEAAYIGMVMGNLAAAPEKPLMPGKS